MQNNKQPRSNPLSFVDTMHQEVGNHSARVQLCVLNDLKTILESKQYL